MTHKYEQKIKFVGFVVLSVRRWFDSIETDSIENTEIIAHTHTNTFTSGCWCDGPLDLLYKSLFAVI